MGSRSGFCKLSQCRPRPLNRLLHRVYLPSGGRPESRTPDIGPAENVRFLASGARPDPVAQAQARPREDRLEAVELFAEGRDGARSVRRAERGENHAQLAIRHFKISGACESGLNERASFVLDAPVVRRHQLSAW